MLLKDKKILIMGIRNKWSIAYGIAKSAYDNGAKLIFTYMGEENKDKIEALISEFEGSKAYVLDGASEDEKFVIQQGANITLFECPDKQEELFGWLFIKYLTNYESSLKWALNTGYFPIRKDVADSQEYEEYLNSGSYDYWGNPVDGYDPIKEAIKVGLKQADYFYVTPTFPGSSLARSEGEFIIKAILYNQKEYDVDRAIKEALATLENS